MPERPSIQSAESGDQALAERVPATEQQVKDTVQHDDAPDEITWDHVTTARDQLTGWLAPYKRWALAHAGIDGYGVDVSFEVEAGIGVGGVGVEPTGVSILWITHSEATTADEGVDVDPLANPHFFLFSSTSYSTGIDLGASGGVGAEFFYGVRYGDGPITRGSWAGPVVSLDVEAGGKFIAGGEGSGSYFSSVDYDKTMAHGALSFGFPNTGWHGISYSGELEIGFGIELDIGMTATQANASIADHFGRPDVRKVFQQEDPAVPDQLEKGYQRDTTGGSILTWLGDWSSGVGEALEE